MTNNTGMTHLAFVHLSFASVYQSQTSGSQDERIKGNGYHTDWCFTRSIIAYRISITYQRLLFFSSTYFSPSSLAFRFQTSTSMTFYTTFSKSDLTFNHCYFSALPLQPSNPISPSSRNRPSHSPLPPLALAQACPHLPDTLCARPTTLPIRLRTRRSTSWRLERFFLGQEGC
jgi:hypothetical protein